ncbi:MFS transporter [Kocuria flava]|uniref:MFS transporter n=1 Tax=Kocuria flava TaxID=446860 RepID=A0A2N4SYY0_9MICC|nr:MFS transporter [Kocuria flava]PLC11190.1 MFS transporter [Kocuria flava]
MTTLLTSRPTAGAREWAALAVLMLPVLLVSVDNTALSFALPAVSQALRPTGAQLLWIVDVYALVLAGLLIPMGSQGDRVGRRRLLLVGGTGFALVSAATAFAPTAELLVAGRAAMGLFGAMLMPATLSLLRNIFLDARQRRIAVAVWAAGFSGGAALGPIVGGFLLNHFWWGSVFLMAVPVLVPLLVLGPLLIPESRDPRPGPVDVPSVVLAMLAMTPVVYGIKALTASGRLFDGLLATAFGVLFGVLFARRQAVLATPMLDLGLFRERGFTGGVAVNVLGNVGLYGFLFMLTQYLQLVVGLDPMTAGLTMVPGLVLTVLAGFAAVRAVTRVAPRTVIVTGMLLSAAGFLGVALADLAAGPVVVLAAFCLVGAGIGLAETLSNDLILAAAPPHKAGAASAISETGYEVGAVAGTAVLGGLLTAFYQHHLDLPRALDTGAAAAAHETLGAAVGIADEAGALGPAVREAAFAAFTAGMHWTAVVMAVVGVLAALTVARVLRPATR